LSQRSGGLGAEYGARARAGNSSCVGIFGFEHFGIKKLFQLLQSIAIRTALSAAIVGGLVNYSFAFDMPGSITTMTPRRSGGTGEGPSRDYTALPFGSWMLQPTVFGGVVYDDGVNNSATNPGSAVGVRIVPRLVAVRNTGIHNTTIYGTVDARLYGGTTSSNSVSARVGVAHEYEAMRDLIFRFQGDYTRQTDIFNSASSFSNASSFTNSTIVQNPFASANLVSTSPYNQFTGAASVTKMFNRTFVGIGTNVSHIAYDNTAKLVGGTLVPSALDGTVYSLSGRIGYWVTPVLYAFTESSVDRRSFQTSTFDATGYRVVGGLGSDRIGFFRGEIFAGYQAVHQDAAGIGSPSSGVYGGRLSYFPTRYWTVRVSLDETLGVSTVATPSSPVGTSTKVTTALLQTDYALSRVWNAGARFGFTRIEYTGLTRLDEGWLAGATFNYSRWRNLALTFDYQMTKIDSTAPFASFTRNVVTVGGTYKY
jgi:hypothetical protein